MLVKFADDVLKLKHEHGTLDLTPTCETRRVRTMRIRQEGCLHDSFGTEFCDQSGRFVKRVTIHETLNIH